MRNDYALRHSVDGDGFKILAELTIHDFYYYISRISTVHIPFLFVGSCCDKVQSVAVR